MTDSRRQHWFGEPWPSAHLRAPICDDDAYRIATPVGEACLWCEESVAEGDRGVRMPGLDADGAWSWKYAHIECQFMNVAGPPAFHEGRCVHAGGTEPCHDPQLGYRQEAVRAWVGWGA